MGRVEKWDVRGIGIVYNCPCYDEILMWKADELANMLERSVGMVNYHVCGHFFDNVEFTFRKLCSV
jgi:hypothetical protein